MHKSTTTEGFKGVDKSNPLKQRKTLLSQAS